jgi:ATP-dependent DNA ligase
LRDFARAGVVLFKRSGLDWTNRMSAIAADVSRLLIGNLVIDGAQLSRLTPMA